MKITVLVDNNTLIDNYFEGEPALSFFIEEGEKRVLFDTGYSGLFLKNATLMGIDPAGLDYVVLSHGHLDHTWGLTELVKYYTNRDFQGKKIHNPALLCHSLALTPTIFENTTHIGNIINDEVLKKYFDLNLTTKPFWVTENLVFLGEIPRQLEFETTEAIGEKQNPKGDTTPDEIYDDSALAWCSEKGIVIITGCSHSGICNITEYAKQVCKNDTIIDIIGGFHLLSASRQQLRNTAEYLYQRNVKDIHPCHCTDLEAKIFLSGYCNVREVGVGSTFKF
ncbi:MBL fold metallo-hydrolase [Methanohalophilus halophilus]|uniref:7,8-dihydropterin-6-yl-methyl-4-(Beta-D-ribofuranosyl)aminobenzene 5'-phosphate synthase n=1 Tax=Methanohalophilus halophilus TaxID=2177 RepID=A0A1L3Q468_9EURY|nr:MBL fold metallo-hydrolase [Methanohalophilus halophilus]APH39672.1 MBL fold metallo-hydrolase [Methanohalophilus halophilus]RNI08993.1 MBL fold metallo-hydrolase [Methanohalophilus halophilus]SDW35322.1 7,8-dihydropterin-6-yl-methyl-4-(beta-D-ribofuranosyl)aminobenzene 5'-phosphate synthase [Methanohalophilus halophilus]